MRLAKRLAITVDPNINNDWSLGEGRLMHISLTPELEKVVRKIKSGLYDNASEVIREALRNSLKQEAENEWLKREAVLGFAQLEGRETVRAVEEGVRVWRARVREP